MTQGSRATSQSVIHQRPQPQSSFDELNTTKNSGVAVLDYSPRQIVTEELGPRELDEVERPDRSTEFELADQIDSANVSQDDDGDEAVMLELNHKSLRLLQAQVIDHIEQLGQAALLYTLEQETTSTFNKALNECFSTNRELTNELYRLKERHDQSLMDELAEAPDSSED